MAQLLLRNTELRQTTGQTGQSDNRWIEQLRQLVMQARRLNHTAIERALLALLASKARAA